MNETRATTFEIDRRLRRVALPQLGLVTVDQAARAGVDRWALMRRRREGALELVFSDVVRLTAWPSTIEQRILAAALAVPGSMIAAASAAIVHALPVGQGVDRPMVSATSSRSARTDGVLTIRHKFLLPSQPWHSVRVATPAATLVLLPRFVDADAVERCVDHCIVHRLITADRVLDLIEGLPRTAVTGRRDLMEMLEKRLDRPGHRSRLEQRVARWLNASGLIGWRQNYSAPVGVGRPIEVDFAWPAVKIALEVSPFFTHGSRAAQERDIERRRLLVLAGWRVIEATDPDLHSERTFGRTTATLRALLNPIDVCALRGAGSNTAHNLGTQRRAG